MLRLNPLTLKSRHLGQPQEASEIPPFFYSGYLKSMPKFSIPPTFRHDPHKGIQHRNLSDGRIIHIKVCLNGNVWNLVWRKKRNPRISGKFRGFR
jgi:hypothetical protein